MGPVALIRHTRARVAPGICYGRTDIPPEEDRAGAEYILAQLCAIQPRLVWSSPARRCHWLAQSIAGAFGAALSRDERLLELDFGAWEGRPWDDIPRADLDRWVADPLGFAPPGGETGAALIARATAFYRDLRGEDGPQAVITHGGPLRVLSALARGVPVDLLRLAPSLGSCEIVAVPAPSVTSDMQSR